MTEEAPSTPLPQPVSARLPAFPWDQLAAYKQTAAAHEGGIVDLSIGAPIDPVPAVVREALGEAADARGYPQASGTAALRESAAGWLQRRLGVTRADPAAIVPTIGSKELISWLPTLLGLGPGDIVAIPELAYPSYDAGVRVTGAEVVATDGLLSLGPRRVSLVWLNTPGNPHGRVLPAEHLAKVVAWCREHGAVLACDECYAEFGWEAEPVSVLHESVVGDSPTGVLAVHSLSKRSNLAGYRAGFVAGDPELIGELLALRRHTGMLVPAPVQAAMRAALDDDAHVEAQRERYAKRRSLLWDAVVAAGFRVDHSEAGLYLWVSRDESCWDTVDWLAKRGILAAPGEFYGASGARHVRLALTAPDERIDVACARLTA